MPITPIFVDTSALYALLDVDDANHLPAAAIWKTLLKGGATLVTTNYVLIETVALVQSRLGLEAVDAFLAELAPVLAVRWIDEAAHRIAQAMLLAIQRRAVSLVDCSSFVIIRELGYADAFAFDRHFIEQGFILCR
jgi:predicted nucleic acid-binding protein